MRYLVDTDAKTITTLEPRSVDDILALRKIVAKMPGYTLEIGSEATPMAFNAPSFPDASMNEPHTRKRIGFK